MTGFAYDGSQYDAATWDGAPADPTNHYLEGGNQYSAGHWDADPARGSRWVISPPDETPARVRVTNVVLRPTRCEVSIRARSAAERDILARLDDDAGEVDTRAYADGRTQGLDTSGGSNTYTLRPSTALRPPRIERDWLVESIERDRTSADTRATAATVEFVAATTRDRDATSYADGSQAGAWQFDFNAPTGGTLYTERVNRIRQGETDTVALFLTRYQAEVLESVAPAVAGATTQATPDGPTVTRDTTPDDRQTVDVTPPASAADPAISAGTYVVAGWTVTGDDAGSKRVELSIDTAYTP